MKTGMSKIMETRSLLQHIYISDYISNASNLPRYGISYLILSSSFSDVNASVVNNPIMSIKLNANNIYKTQIDASIVYGVFLDLNDINQNSFEINTRTMPNIELVFDEESNSWKAVAIANTNYSLYNIDAKYQQKEVIALSAYITNYKVIKVDGVDKYYDYYNNEITRVSDRFIFSSTDFMTGTKRVDIDLHSGTHNIAWSITI